MRGRNRFLSLFLCFLVLLAVLPLNAFAAEEESGYRLVIEDEADLLTDAEEEELRAVMERILPFGNAAFVSVNHNDTTTKELAENKYNELFGEASGVILVIDMDNRYILLTSRGKARKTINNARASEITDNVYSYVTREEYASGASRAFEQVARILEGERVAASPLRYVTNAFLAVCLALFGNFALVSLQRRKKVAPENALKVKVALNTASSAVKAGLVAGVALHMLNQRRTRHAESSGGGRSGGGFSGGGHSGGGFSGGGHRF